MLRRRTIRGPATGFFHTAVCTVLPCQVTSCGSPTLTDSRDPADCLEVTTSSPSHGGEPLAPVTTPGPAGLRQAEQVTGKQEATISTLDAEASGTRTSPDACAGCTVKELPVPLMSVPQTVPAGVVMLTRAGSGGAHHQVPIAATKSRRDPAITSLARRS